jgi:hypothetical protein
VLDAVKGDLGGLRARLGREEAAKLDVHLESLRELERGLGASTCDGGVPVPDPSGSRTTPPSPRSASRRWICWSRR